MATLESVVREGAAVLELPALDDEADAAWGAVAVRNHRLHLADAVGCFDVEREDVWCEGWVNDDGIPRMAARWKEGVLRRCPKIAVYAATAAMGVGRGRVRECGRP